MLLLFLTLFQFGDPLIRPEAVLAFAPVLSPRKSIAINARTRRTSLKNQPAETYTVGDLVVSYLHVASNLAVVLAANLSILMAIMLFLTRTTKLRNLRGASCEVSFVSVRILMHCHHNEEHLATIRYATKPSVAAKKFPCIATFLTPFRGNRFHFQIPLLSSFPMAHVLIVIVMYARGSHRD